MSANVGKRNRVWLRLRGTACYWLYLWWHEDALTLTDSVAVVAFLDVKIKLCMYLWVVLHTYALGAICTEI